MPEPPDFDQIARHIARHMTTQSTRDVDADDIATIIEQLRQVWNARGAADLAAVDNNLMTDDVGLKRAIRALDR